MATILVGDDPASHVYVSYKHKDAESVGMTSIDVKLPSSSTQAGVLAAVDDLNERSDVWGMIVQLTLPAGLDGEAAVERVGAGEAATGAWAQSSSAPRAPALPLPSSLSVGTPPHYAASWRRGWPSGETRQQGKRGRALNLAASASNIRQ